jgi:hypothetical protein
MSCRWHTTPQSRGRRKAAGPLMQVLAGRFTRAALNTRRDTHGMQAECTVNVFRCAAVWGPHLRTVAVLVYARVRV